MELGEVLNRVARGTKEAVLISGEAGVGKTSLAFAMREQIHAKHAWFGHGKFDQLRRETGTSALLIAFGSLIRQVLALKDSELDLWTTRIQNALGADAQLLTNAIPELDLVIGPQYPASDTATRGVGQQIQLPIHDPHPSVLHSGATARAFSRRPAMAGSFFTDNSEPHGR